MRPGGFLHAFSFGHLLTYTLTIYIRERGKNITFKIRKGLKKKNRKIEKKEGENSKIPVGFEVVGGFRKWFGNVESWRCTAATAVPTMSSELE